MTNLLPFKLLRKKVRTHLMSFNPTGKLVDLGCGSGNLIVEIAKTKVNLELIGVDISPEILNLAKKRSVDSNVQDQIKFKIGKVENLPLSDNSIDYLLSTLSLHHWKDPMRAFDEFFRVLKDEGKILIFDFRRDARKIFYGFLKFITKIIVPKALKAVNEPISSLYAGYTPKEIRKMISISPFSNVEIKPFLAWIFIDVKK
jgi:ubiquinone/menaquinone biosynthesis C-methylase UbiE